MLASLANPNCYVGGKTDWDFLSVVIPAVRAVNLCTIAFSALNIAHFCDFLRDAHTQVSWTIFSSLFDCIYNIQSFIGPGGTNPSPPRLNRKKDIDNILRGLAYDGNVKSAREARLELIVEKQAALIKSQRGDKQNPDADVQGGEDQGDEQGQQEGSSKAVEVTTDTADTAEKIKVPSVVQFVDISPYHDWLEPELFGLSKGLDGLNELHDLVSKENRLASSIIKNLRLLHPLSSEDITADTHLAWIWARNHLRWTRVASHGYRDLTFLPLAATAFEWMHTKNVRVELFAICPGARRLRLKLTTLLDPYGGPRIDTPSDDEPGAETGGTEQATGENAGENTGEKGGEKAGDDAMDVDKGPASGAANDEQDPNEDQTARDAGKDEDVVMQEGGIVDQSVEEEDKHKDGMDVDKDPDNEKDEDKGPADDDDADAEADDEQEDEDEEEDEDEDDDASSSDAVESINNYEYDYDDYTLDTQWVWLDDEFIPRRTFMDTRQSPADHTTAQDHRLRLLRQEERSKHTGTFQKLTNTLIHMPGAWAFDIEKQRVMRNTLSEDVAIPLFMLARVRHVIV